MLTFPERYLFTFYETSVTWVAEWLKFFSFPIIVNVVMDTSVYLPRGCTSWGLCLSECRRVASLRLSLLLWGMQFSSEYRKEGLSGLPNKYTYALESCFLFSNWNGSCISKSESRYGGRMKDFLPTLRRVWLGHYLDSRSIGFVWSRAILILAMVMCMHSLADSPGALI